MMSSSFQFEDLMSMAERNIRQGKKQIKNFIPPPFGTVSKPKPQQTTKEKQLSEGVKKFLEKKKEEERQEAAKKQVEKERLLQLRFQDKKANRRVNAMLRMTKSASKACMVDAQDSFSDALAEQGEIQPDEDDYGYVSEYAQNFQKKLMEKYRKLPVAPKFPTRPSLPPAPVPHAVSKSKSKDSYDDAPAAYQNHSFKEPEPPESVKKKNKPPPPLNFKEMLELAAKKSQQPIQFAKAKTPGDAAKETFEFGRPMTAKEKAAYIKEKAYKDRAIAKFSGNSANASSSSSSSNTPDAGSKPKVGFKIPSVKKKESSKPLDVAAPVPLPSSSKVKSSQDLSASSKNISAGPEISSSKPDSNHRPIVVASRSQPSSSASQKKPSVLGSSSKQVSTDRMKTNRPSHSSPDTKRSSASSSQDKPRQTNQVPDRRELTKPKSGPPPPSHARDDSRSRERLPQKASASQMYPDERRRMSPPRSAKFPQNSQGHPKQRPMKRRNVVESDEEYDSEMDDFIDDDDEPVNYSDMIRAITGYDRNKYKDIDLDDIQESSVFEQWKEEQYSARQGKLEDLEEERKEKEEMERERKQKLMQRKKMRR